MKCNMNFRLADAVLFDGGGEGVVVYADVEVVLVKFESGDYDLFDQYGDGMNGRTDSISLKHGSVY